MKALKAMITTCVVFFALLLATSIFSEVHGKSMKLEHASEVHRNHSVLEQDQIVLAADMRKLRRNLRRGVNPLQIARERDGIRQDWLNIVADRGLQEGSFSPALVSFGR